MFVALNLNLVNNSPVSALYYKTCTYIRFKVAACVVHSHIDCVGLQGSIAEMISVVLLHAVIVLSDHVRSCHTVIILHRGSAISRHTSTTSDVHSRA